MSTVKNGLSYFEGGGSANAPSAADDDNVQDIGSRAGTLVEMGKGKGMNVAGKIPLSAAGTSEMLAKMQALLDERQGPMNTFLSGLQRASAWGSGGVNGPSAALTAMDRQRQLEQADTLAMQQNIAAMKAQSEARQRGLANLGLPGYAPQGQAQTGDQGQPQTGAVPNYQTMINSLPTHLRPIAIGYLRNEDIDSFNSMMLANEKNRTTEAKNLDLINSMPDGPQKDMLKAQAFKEAVANRSIITNKGEIPFTPEYAPRPLGMRGTTTPPPTTGGVDLKQVALNAGVPADAIISDYRDPTKQLGLIDRPDPNKPGSYLTKEGRPVALPGQSPHQIPGAAIDIRPGYKLSDTQKQALAQAGAVEVPGDPGHYQLPMPKMNAALAANATTPVGDVGGFDPRSLKGQEIVIKGIQGDNESIIKEVQNPMLAKVVAEKGIADQITRTLNILDKTRTGPGASTAQLVTELKGFFTDLKPEELQQLINQKTITQTQANLVASGVKAAFGAQLSDKEGDRFVKTLFTIDDPKEFIRATLELRRAATHSNRAFADYLLGKPEKAKAIKEYQTMEEQKNSEILKKYAPTVYAQMQKAEKAPVAAETAKPANIPKEYTLAPDGKYYAPDPKRPGKYLMFKE